MQRAVSFVRHLTLLLAAAGLAVSSVALADPAASAMKQVATAIEHAGYASKSKTSKVVHVHLHHVINCLEGTKGPDFDAKVGDPCKGQGDGALNDLKSAGSAVPHMADVQKTLDQAHQLALIGVNVEVHKSAQDVALAVRGLLEDAEHMMKAKK